MKEGSVVLLDVRSGDEFGAGRQPGAVRTLSWRSRKLGSPPFQIILLSLRIAEAPCACSLPTPPHGRVKSPRHFVFYRVAKDDVIEVVSLPISSSGRARVCQIRVANPVYGGALNTSHSHPSLRQKSPFAIARTLRAIGGITGGIICFFQAVTTVLEPSQNVLWRPRESVGVVGQAVI